MHEGRLRPARHDQGVEVREAERQRRAAAAVAFGVLVVVGRLEGADRLAHEREVAGQRADGEDERLLRIVPRPVRLGVLHEEKRGEAAAARHVSLPSTVATLPRPVTRSTTSTRKWSLIMAHLPSLPLRFRIRRLRPPSSPGSRGGRTARTGRSGCRRRAPCVGSR